MSLRKRGVGGYDELEDDDSTVLAVDSSPPPLSSNLVLAEGHEEDRLLGPSSSAPAEDNNGDRGDVDAVGGAQSIDYLGSLSYVINNVTGPAMITLPSMIQKSGWLFPSIAFAVCMATSSLASTMLAESMSLVPGNASFGKRVEFVGVLRFYFGRFGYVLGQVLVNVSLQAMNLATIIVSGKVVDMMSLSAFGRACALELYPSAGFVCKETVLRTADGPFDGTIVITAGLVAVMCFSVPFSFMNLDDNIVIQKITCAALFLLMALWSAAFLVVGLRFPIPAVGDDQSSVIGTVLFNYAYVILIPSWVNEKAPGVDINRVIWVSNVVSTVSFLVLGLGGAAAFRFPGDSDLLSAVASSSELGTSLSRAAVFMYPFVCLIPSIPVVAIIVRYNLRAAGGLSRSRATLLAAVLPWAVAVPFYTGEGLESVINWASLLFNSVIDFIVPFLLFLKATELLRRGRKASLAGDVAASQIGGGAGRFRAVPASLRFPLSDKTLAFACAALMGALCLVSIIQGFITFSQPDMSHKWRIHMPRLHDSVSRES